MNKELRGSLALLAGAAIWGAAFTAQRMGMDSVGPFYFTGIRMLLAALAVTPLILLSDRRRKRAGWTGKPSAEAAANQRRAGLLCGLLLFLATNLQQVGLIYTAAGKAGFLTALYVVLVPVAGWILFRKNPGRVIWLGVALALGALYLLCVPAGGFQLEKGDLLVLGCAVCFTGQILCVDCYAPVVDGLRLSRDQFLVTGVLSLLIAVFTESISLERIRAALIPILYSGVLSGGMGYTLQIIGQRDVNPTLASLLMCMESVFAVLTGAVVLGERLTGREIWGCALMLAAVVLAQLSPAIGKALQKKAATASRRRSG
ncbi:MAG: DMT family transporter [Clostridia bacterium]|nr:DMT family transporter [Clostridia bacterium]